MKHHYVYRITNLIMKMHYYGVRTCKTDPSIDIGKVYFSSSTDKEFMLDQKENPKNIKNHKINNRTNKIVNFLIKTS